MRVSNYFVGQIFLALFLGQISLQAQSPEGELAKLPPSVTNSIYYQRWLWHRQDRLLPDGRVPYRGRELALERIRKFKEQSSQPAISVQQALPQAAVVGNAWAPIGPAPIVNGQTSGSQPVSGRIGDIAVNPSNANHWVVGTAQGGVWRTLNAGATWTAISDDQASLAFGAVAFAPSATNIIYAGTGEEVFSADAVSGAGLLKSTDSGATWQLLAGSTFSGATFSTIRVHPQDPNVLLASTSRGIYKSVNGGVSWTQKRSGTGTDIEVDSGNFTNQYCAIGSTGGSSLNGVYRSTNLGETWTLVTGPWSSLSFVGRIELAISPSNPSTLYVSIGNSSTSGLLGMWRTDDAWSATPTWTQLPDPGSGFTTQLWYDQEIIVDPINPNVIYAAAVSIKRFNGVSWTDVLGTVHVDFHALTWAGGRLIVGSDGGVWSTINGGSSWTDHNTNLQLTQFYHGSINPANPNFALGGSQDNGTARWDGTNGWRLVLGGDGADNAISSSNPSIHWAASFQNLEIRRTRNGGASFDDAIAGIGTSGRPFIGRFEKAHHNDDIFITGTTQIWKTTNFFTGATVSWSSNSPDLGASFRSAAFARSDLADNTYACGFSGGAMRITTDGGATWRDLDPLNNVPGRSVSDLAFNPTNANILYASLSGASGGTPANLYRTVNALAPTPSWFNVSYPVDISANTIAMDQDDPNILYIGSDIGVWKTINGGGSWVHMGPEVGMPNVEIDELRLNNPTGRLVAFTHGRGAFVLYPANTSDISITQTESSDPASIGCPLTYSLTVANRGPADATGVIVTNRLPAGANFLTASASQGTVEQNGSTLIVRLGALSVADAATIDLIVTPTSQVTLTNIARVRADQSDPDPSNNISTETTLAAVDTTGPSLLSAEARADGKSLLLTFSEVVSPSDATMTANYHLLDGLTNQVAITGAVLGAIQGTVELSVDLLTHFGPFSLSASNITDCIGNAMNPVAGMFVTLPPINFVPTGSFWKYLDDGSNQGTAWRAPDFNDDTWASGQAQLGYGDGDETTLLSFGPDPNAKFATTYFRHEFMVTDASKLTNLTVNLLRDDGAIIYLNGSEIIRSNMPGGIVTSSTFALATVNGADENTYFASRLSNLPLVNGRNVLAVEIHQANGTSSDVSFDLGLTAELRVFAVRPFYVQQPESQTALVGDTVRFNVLVGGTPPFGYRWRFKAGNLVPFSEGTATLVLNNVQLTNSGNYDVVVTNAATSSGVLSAAANLTVLTDSDGDRMPDLWEDAYGFDRNDPSDAAQDADNDGVSNLQEFLCGTDPRDANSFLKIDQITAEGNAVRLRFMAVSNRNYSVLYRESLAPAGWLKLTNVFARATNRLETLKDSAAGQRERYYRLVTPRQP